MSATTTNQTFPAGLVDFILPQLSLSLRNHIIFNWAHLFTQCADQDLLIAEIISTIITLDFSSHRSIDPNTFTALSNLPLLNLKHLDLSHIPLGDHLTPEIIDTISISSVFDNLESLNLSNTEQKNTGDLLDGPNSFPKLTTLDLSQNRSISLNSLFNTNKLPNLRHLNLSRCLFGGDDVKTMAESNVVFKLESFNLSHNRHHNDVEHDPFITLFKAPFLTNITELDLTETPCNLAALSFLLDDKAGPFALTSRTNNQLTRLCLGGSRLNQKVICDLASTSLVSNLTHLNLTLDPRESIDLGVLAQSKYLSNLKQLSINFNHNPASLAPLLCPPDNDAACPHFCLDKLQVHTAKISHKDIMALCAAPCLSTLDSLSLIDCQNKGDIRNMDGIELLSKSTMISKLTHLDLCDLFDLFTNLKSLLRSDQLSSDLIHLNLSGNELDEECIEIITSRRVNEGDKTSPLKFGKLQTLDLGDCTLENGALASITQLTELQHLNIPSYRGDDCDDLINSLIETQKTFPFLPKLAHLTHLNLSESNIVGSGAIMLSESQLLNSLVNLDLTYNDLGNRGMEALLTTKLVSKLKLLSLYDDGEELIEHFPYLVDCEVSRVEF